MDKLVQVPIKVDNYITMLLTRDNIPFQEIMHCGKFDLTSHTHAKHTLTHTYKTHTYTYKTHNHTHIQNTHTHAKHTLTHTYKAHTHTHIQNTHTHN